MKFVVRIIITALAVLLAANLVPGIYVSGFWVAVLVALVLGILNSTLGLILKILTFPLTILSFGFFLLVVNALMFKAATFIKGFDIIGFWPAFWGSLIVTIISMVAKSIMKEDYS